MEIEAWKIFLPYCIKRIDSERWIFLNRKYKPLGVSCPDFIEYRKEKSLFCFGPGHIAKLKEILGAPKITSDGNLFFYLYPDGVIPSKSNEYLDRLNKIMDLKTVRGDYEN
jgi:hypothetical protein